MARFLTLHFHVDLCHLVPINTMHIVLLSLCQFKLYDCVFKGLVMGGQGFFIVFLWYIPDI